MTRHNLAKALSNKVLQLTVTCCHGPGIHRDGLYFSQVGS